MLRFAPSPTGDMHIGNLRAAIFNFILAKQKGEKFLIRIEDTDFSRNIDGKDKEILSTLNLFSLLWDQVVYQSHNFSKHQRFAQMLIDQGLAFYCYCTKEFLEQKKQEAIASKQPFRYQDSWAELHKDTNPKPVIRLKGSSSSLFFEDKIKGKIEFDHHELDSFVILREDGIPTYNFACAIDDMLYDISFIVRGEDHVSNTPKQMLIQKYLHYEKEIQYAHLPIILGEDGKKMSKRDASSSVNYLLEQGFLPQAITNYLIGMGNKTPTEVFNLNEVIGWFDISHIAKSPVKFDLKRLRFLNREHLKRLNESEFALLLETQDLSVGALAKLFLEEASTLNEIREKINLIFMPKDIHKIYEDQSFYPQCKVLFETLKEISDTQDCSKMDYSTFKTQAMQKSQLKGKDFFKPLRILLTGESHGLDLETLFNYLRLHLKEVLKIKEG
ncbi:MULTISPECIES: glutamate--tRNA ligase [unclassified Helicobacter]|uniref:glutamate--tRNA ligase n=1 Tax=unclassified Helicobacter TaxID=2593540 RepID=UPI000CF1A396|nr:MULTISPECIES: glutamate--tRNA ligase [unclassified Helicobacter]